MGIFGECKGRKLCVPGKYNMGNFDFGGGEEDHDLEPYLNAGCRYCGGDRNKINTAHAL